jgi:hypothetical protein
MPAGAVILGQHRHHPKKIVAIKAGIQAKGVRRRIRHQKATAIKTPLTIVDKLIVHHAATAS